MNRDDADMAVPEEIRMRLSHWCAARVPAGERDHRQVAYTIHGDAITIHERRPPAYPELGPAWSATPVARLLRLPDGWLLERPTGRGEWRRDTSGSDPIALLESVRA
jgi:hypothetical protein